MKRFHFTMLPMLAATLLCAGCKWATWIGFKNPQPHHYLPVEGYDVRIGVQNLDTMQRQAVLAATRDIFEILHSTEFREIVEAKTWLVDCERQGDQANELSGEAVYQRLVQPLANFSVHPRKPVGAIGQAQRNVDNLAKNRIAVHPSRINAWYSSSDSTRAQLVNTLTHEMTHLVSGDFKDDGHHERDCPQGRLVSYGIGNLVDSLWMTKGW